MSKTTNDEIVLKLPKTKMVVEILKHEGFIRSRIYELKHDVSRPKLPIKGNRLSNPTENQAIRNLKPIKQIECDDGFVVKKPEKWLEIIDELYAFCRDTDQKKILKAWLSGNRSVTRISIDLGISKTSVYDIRQTLQNYAVALAAQYGLINISVKEGEANC